MSFSPEPQPKGAAWHSGRSRRVGALLKGDGGREGDANPNGSVNDIAVIYSKDLNVLGLMPHPENLIEPLVDETDGCGLFESLAGYAKVA